MIDFSKYPLPERFRHHLSANNYMPREQIKYEPYNYPPLYESIDWSEHFANGNAPKYLDIGCGFGWFSLQFAEQIEENILGIEVRPKAVEYAQNIVKSENIRNCSFLWYSVVNGLDFIERNSVKKIFYFFPDPWFKKKHHKRRAFDTNFLKFCYGALEPEGELLLQTDIDEVHEYHIETLKEFAKFDFEILELNKEWDYPVTNKERECIAKGFEYFRIKAVKNVY